MFETVAPDAFSRRDRHVFYETLPASIAIHGIVAAAVAIAIAAQVTLPVEPPKLLVAYLAADLREPVPPPPPPPAAKQADAPKTEAKLETSAPVALTPIDLAPAKIPDEITEMPRPSAIRLVSASVDKFVPAGGGGVSGGVAGGSFGGTQGGVAGGVLGGDGRVHFERDARLPLYAEAHPYPEYPDICINTRQEGMVVIKYVIGRTGQVTEASIISHGVRKEFDESTLDAIRKWKFRPLLVDGEAMEVVHELTVYFRLY
jgi:protein TonB